MIKEELGRLHGVWTEGGDSSSRFQVIQELYQDHGVVSALIDGDGQLQDPFDLYFTGVADVPDIGGMADFLLPLNPHQVQVQIPIALLFEGEPSLLFELDHWLETRQVAEFSLMGRVGLEGLIPSSLTLLESLPEGATITAVEPIRWENNLLHHLVMAEGFMWNDLRPQSNFILRGTITDAHVPPPRVLDWLGGHPLFLSQVREFQVRLAEGLEVPGQGLVLDKSINSVAYRVFVQPLGEQTGDGFIFALSSLQPVDEALALIQNYYLYVALSVLLLVFLLTFYYSRFLVKPLLAYNEAAQKIVDLDFSTELAAASQDEIGDLGRNMNLLSRQLHGHISQLEQEIHKERALEETRKEFISNVSHELKTPLSVIKSSIEVLQEGFLAKEEQDYFFEAIHDEIHHMDQLILDMLELAKLTSGTFNMSKETFGLGGLVQDILKKQDIILRQKDLQVRAFLPDAEVLGNPRYLGQVVSNFITNAITHTPAGEQVRVMLQVLDGRVRFSVENTGTQIPEEVLGKVWDRFYRVDKARYRSSGGTGLGLAISQSILKLHDASYGAQNTEDGVLFYFELGWISST